MPAWRKLPSLSKRPTDLLLLPKARSLTTRRNRIGRYAEWAGDPEAVAEVTRYVHRGHQNALDHSFGQDRAVPVTGQGLGKF